MRNRHSENEAPQSSTYDIASKGSDNRFVDFEIIGQNFPALRCYLKQGETMKCEGGSMAWMDDNIKMSTEGGGSLGKAFGRALSGESIFFNNYTCESGEGEVVFSSSYPGKIVPIELSGGKSIIAQKSAFLACTEGVNVAMHFKKNLAKGLFGGLGFVMQRYSGEGMVFMEINGDVSVYDLKAGESKLIDAPNLALMEESCTMDIEKISGAKNIFLGGEGLFNTRVTGPGKVWLQTMPLPSLAAAIARYIPTSD